VSIAWFFGLGSEISVNKSAYHKLSQYNYARCALSRPCRPAPVAKQRIAAHIDHR
jgi:hypothetical protein